ISIDKGVMERARNVAVVPATFPWDDVGEWSALLRFGQPDADGNVAVGNVALSECARTVAYNAASPPRTLTAVGLREQIVVMTDDAVMAAPLADAQRVRELVALLRERGRDDLL